MPSFLSRIFSKGAEKNIPLNRNEDLVAEDRGKVLLPEMGRIPEGEFLMGGAEVWEGPIRKVKIAKDFELSKRRISVSEFLTVVKRSGPPS